MSARPAVVMFVVACLLAVASAVLLRPEGPTAAPIPMLRGPDVLASTSITITVDGAPVGRITPAPWADGWLISTPTPGGQRTWPAIASRVQGALRLLADARGQPAQDEPWPGGGLTITLASPAGEQSLSLAEGLGGRTLARVGDGPVHTLASLPMRLFTPEGLHEWLEPGVFAIGPGPFASLEFGGLSLSRAGPQWMLRRGEGTWPADSHAADLAVQAAAALKFRSLMQADPADPLLRLDDATPTLTVRTVVRTPAGQDVRTRELVQELRLGGAADAAGEWTHALVRTRWEEGGASTPAEWGPMVGIVPRRGVDRFAGVASAYVSRRSCRLPAADVATVRLGAVGGATIEMMRTAEGWRPREPGAAWPSAAGVDAMVRLLCDATAAVVEEPAELPTGASTTVDLLPPRGDKPIASVRLVGGVIPGQQTRGVAVVDAPWVRWYAMPPEISEWVR